MAGSALQPRPLKATQLDLSYNQSPEGNMAGSILQSQAPEGKMEGSILQP